MNKKIKVFSYIRIIIYTAAIIAAVLLVKGKITTSCYWNERYGVLCPTCGVTRATISILGLNIIDAIKYHAVYTCIVFPIAFAIMINDIFVMIKRAINKSDKLSIVEKICGINKSKNKTYILIIIAIAILFVSYGLIRNWC